MEEVIKIETVNIGKGYKIRDGSGYYACPKCWKAGSGGLILHGATVCTSCGAKLIWID